MVFFAVSASASSRSSSMTYTQSMRVMKYPVIRAHPTYAAIFSAGVSPNAGITLIHPLPKAPVYWKQYALELPTGVQQHCLSTAELKCQPLHGSDMPFPDDIFEYVFGVKQQKLHAGTLPDSKEITHCENIALITSRIIWVTGNCYIPAGTSLGSEASPVLLIVEDGHLSFASGVTLSGMLVTLSRKSQLPKDIVQHNTSLITGAVIIAQPLSTRSALRIVYAKEILATLQNASYAQHTSFLTGSWHDF